MKKVIAYFSMEIGLDHRIPTYAGGLGILAGDIIKSFADEKMPCVGITLLYNGGYFYQEISEQGQEEHHNEWNPDDFLKKCRTHVEVRLEGRKILLNAWYKDVKGVNGGSVRVFFLDSDHPENTIQDREITKNLYPDNKDLRFKQHVILGIGGYKLLDKLGYVCKKYHLNEDHSALLIVDLYNEYGKKGLTHEQVEKRIRKEVVFTTHTPVSAGFSSFPKEQVVITFQDYLTHRTLKQLFKKNEIVLTKFCLDYAGYVNAVSRQHAKISKKLLSNNDVDYITNGVHHVRWTNKHFTKLFNKYLKGWKSNPNNLLKTNAIPSKELFNAHAKSKRELLDRVNDSTNSGLDKDHLTLGFARRMTGYKRPELLLHDIHSLERISEKNKLQIIYAGKAHPNDYEGKQIIHRIIQTSKKLRNTKVVFVKDYDIGIAEIMTSGVDVWVNTPTKGLEASGTSGMKAGLNGVANLSMLEGWWAEGCKNGLNGWCVKPINNETDAKNIYEIIRKEIIPKYNDKNSWAELIRNTIENTGPFFNTQRVVKEYAKKAYK